MKSPLLVFILGSCILAVSFLAGPAHAAGFVQFDVPRQEGAYTVDVLPGSLTLLGGAVVCAMSECRWRDGTGQRTKQP
jgi:hypothetical protein